MGYMLSPNPNGKKSQWPSKVVDVPKYLEDNPEVTKTLKTSLLKCVPKQDLLLGVDDGEADGSGGVEGGCLLFVFCVCSVCASFVLFSFVVFVPPPSMRSFYLLLYFQ